MTILSRTKRPLSTGDKSRTIFRTVNPATLGEMRRSGRTPSRTKARCVRLFEGSLSLGESPNERGLYTAIIINAHCDNFQACVLSALATTNSLFAYSTSRSISLFQQNSIWCVFRTSAAKYFRTVPRARVTLEGLNMTDVRSLASWQKELKKVSPRKPIQCLDERGERLVELMTLGLEPEVAARYPDLPSCEPLTLEQAARVIGLKLKNARYIFASQPFLKTYASSLAAMRNACRARAVSVLSEVMTNPGENLAADRAVRVKAASQLLNDSDGRSGSQLNFQINNGVQLQAGIVVRIPFDIPPTPLEINEIKPEITGN